MPGGAVGLPDGDVEVVGDAVGVVTGEALAAVPGAVVAATAGQP